MKRLVETMGEQFKALGYDSFSQFLNATFKTDTIKPFAFISAVLGFIASFIEEYLGLTAIVYLAFCALVVIEFRTGVKASKKRGEEFESNKFGRIITKLGTYTILIGVTHTFKQFLVPPDFLGFDLKIYHMIYYAFLNLVVLVLLRSVWENLTEIGYKEVKTVSKWFDELTKFRLTKKGD